MGNNNEDDGEVTVRKRVVRIPWVRMLEIRLKHVLALDMSNRAKTKQAITFTHGLASDSLNGWVHWFQSPWMFDLFTDEELKQLAEEFRAAIVPVIQVDAKWTAIVDERAKKNAIRPPEIPEQAAQERKPGEKKLGQQYA